MTITQANAMNDLFDFVLGTERMRVARNADARDAAILLADAASETLHAGINGDNVRMFWYAARSGRAQGQLDSLTKSGRCPDCAGNTFRRGPSGGLTENIQCCQCGSRFNFCPPCTMMPRGFAERI